MTTDTKPGIECALSIVEKEYARVATGIRAHKPGAKKRDASLYEVYCAQALILSDVLVVLRKARE